MPIGTLALYNKSLAILSKAHDFSSIVDVAMEAVEIASDFETTVVFSYKGVHLQVVPGDRPQDVIDKYNAEAAKP